MQDADVTRVVETLIQVLSSSRR